MDKRCKNCKCDSSNLGMSESPFCSQGCADGYTIADLKAQIERLERENNAKTVGIIERDKQVDAREETIRQERQKHTDITRDLEDLQAKLTTCMLMLDNVKYWDTCPDDYIERINKLQADEVQADEIQTRLEYLKGEILAERISYGEIYELQSLSEYIDPGDTVLLEWAGVKE